MEECMAKPRAIFREEHEMFRQTCRRFYEKEVLPYHDQWEEDGQVSREVWLQAGAAGLLCMSLPEQLSRPTSSSTATTNRNSAGCRAWPRAS
jgi:alkylation response protein AidB-like acyl-CoA dehydrogenase